MNASSKTIIVVCVFITCHDNILYAEELVVPAVVDAVVRKFDIGTIRYASGQSKEKTYAFRLYVPPKARKEGGGRKNSPLLVWLHGYNEAGDDNRKHLTWFRELLFRHASQGLELPCYVLAFQCPSYAPSWTSDIDTGGTPLRICKAIIDELISTQPIDKDQLVLIGVSSGGTACWNAVADYPALFAAAAPLGSASIRGEVSALADSTKATPIWAFHTLRDPATPISPVRDMVKEIADAGGACYLTETPGSTHDCWTIAFRDFQLLDWLLSQERGKSSPTPNYWTLANWWQLELQEGNLSGPLTLPAIISLLVAVWLAESRRRQRLLRSKLMEGGSEQAAAS